MIKVYASLIIKGFKTIDDVPEKIRKEVCQALADEGYPEFMSDENAE